MRPRPASAGTAIRCPSGRSPVRAPGAHHPFGGQRPPLAERCRPTSPTTGTPTSPRASTRSACPPPRTCRGARARLPRRDPGPGAGHGHASTAATSGVAPTAGAPAAPGAEGTTGSYTRWNHRRGDVSGRGERARRRRRAARPAGPRAGRRAPRASCVHDRGRAVPAGPFLGWDAVAVRRSSVAAPVVRGGRPRRRRARATRRRSRSRPDRPVRGPQLPAAGRLGGVTSTADDGPGRRPVAPSSSRAPSRSSRAGSTRRSAPSAPSAAPRGSWSPAQGAVAHRRRRQPLRRPRQLLGPDDPRARPPRGGRGRARGGADGAELRHADRGRDRPRRGDRRAASSPVEQVRLVNSGTEATMSAIRLARGFTGRCVVVKFAGCYHGHVDALLAEAGSGRRDASGCRRRRGSPARRPPTPSSLPYNDLDAVAAVFAERGPEIACVITEAAAGNMGAVAPDEGFNAGLKRLVRRPRRAAGDRRGDDRLPRLARRLVRPRGRRRRPVLLRQGHVRRAARRGVRRPRRRHGPPRAGRARLPGRDAGREPRRGRRRASRRCATRPTRSTPRSTRNADRLHGLSPTRSPRPGVEHTMQRAGSLVSVRFADEAGRDYDDMKAAADLALPAVLPRPARRRGVRAAERVRGVLHLRRPRRRRVRRHRRRAARRRAGRGRRDGARDRAADAQRASTPPVRTTVHLVRHGEVLQPRGHPLRPAARLRALGRTGARRPSGSPSTSRRPTSPPCSRRRSSARSRPRRRRRTLTASSSSPRPADRVGQRLRGHARLGRRRRAAPAGVLAAAAQPVPAVVGRAVPRDRAPHARRRAPRARALAAGHEASACPTSCRSGRCAASWPASASGTTRRRGSARSAR